MKNWNAFDWAWRSILIVVGVLVFMSVLSGPAITQEKCTTEVEKFDAVIETSLKHGYTLLVLDSWSNESARGFLVQPRENPEKNKPMWFFFAMIDGCAEEGFPSWYPEDKGYELIKKIEGQGV